MDPVLAWQMERANDRKKLSQIVVELEKMLEPHLKKMDELSVSLSQKKRKMKERGGEKKNNLSCNSKIYGSVFRILLPEASATELQEYWE